jgi:acyl-CoA thioesterase I
LSAQIFLGALQVTAICGARRLFFHRIRTQIILAALLALASPLSVFAGTLKPPCDTPPDLIRLANPLTRVAQKLAAGGSIIVVAIGSSSTAGTGASAPTANYPSQLAIELKRLFPTHSITVLNRGVGGEEVDDMLKRFDTAVIAAKPSLVLWQFGTNSVIRDQKFADESAAIRNGINKIRATGADVVLIDPQFVPKVIEKAEAEQTVESIAATAKMQSVDLFRRFALMKHWHESDHMAFKSFASPDDLHMNDWSYACMAKGLGQAIADAAQRPVVSATATSHPVR